MSTEDKVLTPFEQAKKNITKTAENFSIYSTMEMLVSTIKVVEGLEESEKESLTSMLENIMIEFTLTSGGDGELWN